MLDDILIYENTKRNEKCPCGSGLLFKKCCMQEYRKSKKQLQNVKLSTFSPLLPLSIDEQKKFVEFYIKLMIFSHQYRNKSEIITINDKEQNIQSFIQEERVYFYKNSDNIIEKYVKSENPNDNELIILKGLKKAKFDKYFLLSKSKDFAVIMDKEENLYNIQALNSPFTEIFKQKEKYIGLHTVLIPYKDRYITDGIYEGFEIPKDIEYFFNKIPYQNPSINYTDEGTVSGIQFAITFSIGCDDIDKFKDMEEFLLKKIPNNFTKGLVKLFDNEYSYKTAIFSSFLRSTDFLEILEDENADQVISYIFGACPVINFEKGNDEECIPWDILEHYYKQPLIEKSISYNSYKKAKNDNNKSFSTFYTILGVSQVKENEHEKFIDFLQILKTKDMRKKITIGIENLCEDLGKELNTLIYPTFLDICVDLDDINKEISLYYNYVTNLLIPTVKKSQKYSINKGK